MRKPFLEELKSLINYVNQNHREVNQTKLIEAISMFQKNILSLRKEDVEIKSILGNLTSKKILDFCNKLNLVLFNPPKQKNKLIPLINSLILLKGKKEEFLRIAISSKTSKRVTSSKKPKIITVSSTSEYGNLRKLWLTAKNLSKLEIELKNINMNIIRAIIKPWRIKPSERTKISLISAIIFYIERMRRLSKLGT